MLRIDGCLDAALLKCCAKAYVNALFAYIVKELRVNLSRASVEMAIKTGVELGGIGGFIVSDVTFQCQSCGILLHMQAKIVEKEVALGERVHAHLARKPTAWAKTQVKESRLKVDALQAHIAAKGILLASGDIHLHGGKLLA